MPYDPNLPAQNAPIVSQELRDQFNGLNDAKAPRPVTVNPLVYPPDVQPPDPMTGDLVQKLNELIGALKA